MAETRELRDTIIVQIARIHMYGVSLYHMHLTKGLEDLVILIEIGAITSHSSIAMTQDDTTLKALYSWLQSRIIRQQICMLKDNPRPSLGRAR